MGMFTTRSFFSNCFVEVTRADKGVFGLVVTLGKVVVGCGFGKNRFDKTVVGWIKASLVDLLWLLEKSLTYNMALHVIDRLDLLLPLVGARWMELAAAVQGRVSPSARAVVAPAPTPTRVVVVPALAVTP
jgi:hypothetical protein